MAVQKRNDELVNLLSADFILNRSGAVDYTHLSNNFQIKNSVASGETITIASGYQRLAWDSFTISGTVNLSGDLVIL